MGLCAPARNLYRPVSVTLRLKLFVLIGGLLALMVGAEWLLIETLTKDLRVEVSAVATSVGKDIVRILHPVEAKSPALPAPAAGFRTIVIRDETHVVSSTKTWTTAGGTGFLFIEGPAARTRIPIPETGVRGAVTRFRTRLVLGSLGIVAVGLLAAAFVAHRVARPLVELSRAARTLGEGGFGAQVATREGGEVGEAIAAFNQMSSRLEALERETLALKEREHLGEMGEVARGMAHALRNPLHAVGLSVDELAARLPDDPGAAEVVPELHAALHALVVNAVEASPDGAEISVRVQARDGGSARVTVDDEGPGLPGEVRARLFTPHVTTKPSGSGMGLFLAHRIATTRYGGGLALEDRSSRGTRAVLDLGPRTGGRPA